MKQFFDTNILIYAVDPDGDHRSATAATLVRQGLAKGSLVVSTQVLQEFIYVVRRKLRAKIPDATLTGLVERFATRCETGTDLDLLRAALRRSLADQLSFYDALIIEGALRTGCTELLSEDLQHGRVFGRLTVRNPFT